MEDIPSLETVAALATQAARHFHLLFESLGFVAGFLLVGIGGYRFYACARDPQRSPWTPLGYVVAGVSLVYVNQWYRAAASPSSASTETLGYAPATSDWSTLMMGACLALVQFLGSRRAVGGVLADAAGRGGRVGPLRAGAGRPSFSSPACWLSTSCQTVRVVFATLGTTSPLG